MTVIEQLQEILCKIGLHKYKRTIHSWELGELHKHKCKNCGKYYNEEFIG